MGDEDPEPVTASPKLPARLGWLGIAFAALYLGSVYLKVPFLRPGITLGDLIDAITPLILIFLFALVSRGIASSMPQRDPSLARGLPGPRLLITLGGFALVLGHGIHVAANSIHDAVARAGIADPGGLIYWWDERVSHVTIDVAKLAICVGLTALESRLGTGSGSASRGGLGFLAVGALTYGFIYFAAGIEGKTTSLLLPFCAGYLFWSLKRGRPFPPVRRFYTLGALLSILLFAVWGVWHRGFPEFSEVGLIP